MKSNSLLVLACLVSMPVLAQTLPDEINYRPYEVSYNNLKNETEAQRAVLEQSRTDLSETQKFIREMTAHLQGLASDISDYQNQISSLRRAIPDLQRQIDDLSSENYRLVNDLRARQRDAQSLENNLDRAIRDLRPLEDALNRNIRALDQLKGELNKVVSVQRDTEQKLSRARSEAQAKERQFEQEKSNEAKLRQDLSQIESKMADASREISTLEGSVGGAQRTVDDLKSSLASQGAEVESLKSAVASLRASGAPEADIKAAEEKLANATKAAAATGSELRRAEQQVSSIQTQISNAKKNLESLRSSQSSLPGKISASQSAQSSLSQQAKVAKAEAEKLAIDLSQLDVQVKARMSAVEAQDRAVRIDETNVARQRQYVAGIDRDLNNLRRDINAMSERSRYLNNEMDAREARIAEYSKTIPQLEQAIRQNEKAIAEGNKELSDARVDERTITSQVQKNESLLADLIQRRDAKESEMSQRYNLYNNYYGQAQGIGESQTDPAVGLGDKEGQRLSGVLSKQNGLAVGKEMGRAEARHWGTVRGEIQGYDAGYSEGYASSADRTRAFNEASAKAAEDAELYAQVNFKPGFFEEFVQEEFKKPMAAKLNMMSSFSKSMGMFQMAEGSEIQEAARETVLPLANDELRYSNNLSTPLDASIKSMAADVQTVSSKVSKLRLPEVAFETPTKIPLGTANCNSVYKGLAVFKSACDSAYKADFTNRYLSKTKETFTSMYEAQFSEVFTEANIIEREAVYPEAYKSAVVVSKAEGLKNGKIAIYKDTYNQTYNENYKTELVKAKSKAKNDASNELAKFLTAKPLLTLDSSDIVGSVLRGGSEVEVLAKVKNVSSVAYKGPVLVRFTQLTNVRNVSGDNVLNSTEARSIVEMPRTKLRINDAAKAGEKVVIRGVIDFPGDLYKSARQESFEIVKVLSANPDHIYSTLYDDTPDIKGIFRRNIHTLSVFVTPKYDEIKDGYDVTVKAVGVNSSHIEQKEVNLKTGSLAQNAKKELRFSYTFKDSAKNRPIDLEIQVTYKGELLKKEMITLTPH